MGVVGRYCCRAARIRCSLGAFVTNGFSRDRGSHENSFAREAVDKVALMDGGGIVECGLPVGSKFSFSERDTPL